MTEQELNAIIHRDNVDKGFWEDRLCIPKIMEESNLFTKEQIIAVKKAFKAQMLMLVVSELSEAMEADRKDLMDDKLKHRKGFDVELIDADIRIRDMIGAFDIESEEIREEKLEFNRTRPYKHGKKY